MRAFRTHEVMLRRAGDPRYRRGATPLPPTAPAARSPMTPMMPSTWPAASRIGAVETETSSEFPSRRTQMVSQVDNWRAPAAVSARLAATSLSRPGTTARRLGPTAPGSVHPRSAGPAALPRVQTPSGLRRAPASLTLNSRNPLPPAVGGEGQGEGDPWKRLGERSRESGHWRRSVIGPSGHRFIGSSGNAARDEATTRVRSKTRTPLKIGGAQV